MKNTVRILLVATFCTTVSGRTEAAISWTFGSGGGSTPFSADTPLPSGISSASLNTSTKSGVTVSSPTSGGNPNGYLLISAANGNQAVLNNYTFTLTITASGNATLTTLQFDYLLGGNKSPTAVNWTYSSGTGATSSSFSDSGWKPSSLNSLNIVLNSANSYTATITGSLVDAQSGKGHGTPSVGFDNISIDFTTTPIPEPITYTLVAFGLAFVGVGAGRFYMGRRQHAKVK